MPIHQPLFELRSPTQPALRQRPGTIVQDWRNKPSDQPTMEQPKFPEWPQQKKTTPEPHKYTPTGTTSCNRHQKRS
eukprot:5614602-Amphidinium_carterae.4